MKNKFVFIFLLFIFLASGCTEKKPLLEETFEPTDISVEEQAKAACIKECKNRLDSGINLSAGPCLSDNDVNWMIEDWVCDIAHNPRKDIDDVIENQCNAYREEKAHHFVEIDPECNVIRTV